MSKLAPYLLFDDCCAEAMQSYAEALGGTSTVLLVRDSPMASSMPTNVQHKVVNAQVDCGDFVLSASDWLHPVRQPMQGNMVYVNLRGTEEQVRDWFDKLGQGADETTVEGPKKMPFGLYCSFTDRFGVCWMLIGE